MDCSGVLKNNDFLFSRKEDNGNKNGDVKHYYVCGILSCGLLCLQRSKKNRSEFRFQQLFFVQAIRNHQLK